MSLKLSSLRVAGSGILFGILFAGTIGLTGCKSNGARERQAQEDKALQEAPLSAEEQALVQQEQERLDGVEQQRTGDASTHSCRKAKEVYASSNTKVVDTNGCSAEQLKLEQDAEQKQARDKAAADVGKRLNDMRDKYGSMMKPVGSHN